MDDELKKHEEGTAKRFAETDSGIATEQHRVNSEFENVVSILLCEFFINVHNSRLLLIFNPIFGNHQTHFAIWVRQRHQI